MFSNENPIYWNPSIDENAAAILFIVPNTNKKIYKKTGDIRLYHRFYYTLRGKKSCISKVFQ